ncbi:SIS domain [Cedecea neteri]|uniref:SIS domain n=1 Tax=Cedecea neteri TaxID=158822 RepID=A0A2X2T3C4_9ENTR|nr:SIS domain [Cedecea neteri]
MPQVSPPLPCCVFAASSTVKGILSFVFALNYIWSKRKPSLLISAAAKSSVFLKAPITKNLILSIDHAIDIICSSERIIFVGAGTSGALAKYGARFFSNVGKFSNHIDDPYFPVTNDMARNALAIVLSVSGETEEILRFAASSASTTVK